MECIFCKIIDGDIPCTKIKENDKFIAFLSINPSSKGHTLVVPKKHYADFSDFPAELGNAWTAFTQEIMKMIKSGVGCDAINIGMNNGAAAGQVIFHQHTHIIPRWEKDGMKSWPETEATPEELTKIQKEILKE